MHPAVTKEKPESASVVNTDRNLFTGFMRSAGPTSLISVAYVIASVCRAKPRGIASEMAATRNARRHKEGRSQYSLTVIKYFFT